MEIIRSVSALSYDGAGMAGCCPLAGFLSYYNTPPAQFLEDVVNYLDHEDWRRCIKKDYLTLDPCVYCGESASSWDHLDPESKGPWGPGNLARACGPCNLAKGTFSVLEFLAYRRQGMLPEMRRRQITPYTLHAKRTAFWYQLTKLLAAKTK